MKISNNQEQLEAFDLGINRLAQLDHEIFNEFKKNKTSISKVDTFLDKCPWKMSLRNADIFFATMQYGFTNSFDWSNTSGSFPKEAKDRLEYLLENSYDTLPDFSDRAKKFKSSCDKFAKMDDDTLQVFVKDNFNVTYKDLDEQSKGVIYTKLNHGFWEFFFAAYSSYSDDEYIRKNIRDRRVTKRPKTTHKSGFYEALSSLIEMTGDLKNQKPNMRIGVGLLAGEAKFSETLSGPLTIVSRGAIIGMTSYFDSFDNGFNFRLEDGSEPRDILYDKRLPIFMEDNIYNTDACLIVAPTHLKDIELPKFSGTLYHTIIPSVSVHQAWRTVLPVVIGEIDRLQKKYKKVSVLVQAANFSTLFAFALHNTFNKEEKENINFFDMGRLLDIARPDLCEKYPSFKPLFEEDVFDTLNEHIRIKKSGV